MKQLTLVDVQRGENLVLGRGERELGLGQSLGSEGRQVDDVAYLRFASVYKGFEDAGDFQREVGLLTKTTEPKRR